MISVSDDISLLQRGLGFDPFRSLNNIWSPRSTDNWGSPSNEWIAYGKTTSVFDFFFLEKFLISLMDLPASWQYQQFSLPLQMRTDVINKRIGILNMCDVKRVMFVFKYYVSLYNNEVQSSRWWKLYRDLLFFKICYLTALPVLESDKQWNNFAFFSICIGPLQLKFLHCNLLRIQLCLVSGANIFSNSTMLNSQNIVPTQTYNLGSNYCLGLPVCLSAGEKRWYKKDYCSVTRVCLVGAESIPHFCSFYARCRLPHSLDFASSQH